MTVDRTCVMIAYELRVMFKAAALCCFKQQVT
jgi:hypothetical protein